MHKMPQSADLFVQKPRFGKGTSEGKVLGHDISHNGPFLRPFLVVQFHRQRRLISEPIEGLFDSMAE
jgi:hypothetical protein